MPDRVKVVVVASGHFDPLHAGHVAYLSAARKLGDALVVIVNNDAQCVLKKGRPFMPQWSRLAVVQALRCVSLALLSRDADRSVCETLRAVAGSAAGLGASVVFANGGDVGECREESVCRELGVRMEFGVGGSDKLQSSSALVREALGV